MQHDIKDKHIVITGRLSSPRADLETKIEAAGGKVAKGVSGKTDLLVVGSDPGSKYDKACQLGIPILEESELLDLLAGKTLTVVTVEEEQAQQDTPIEELFGEIRSTLQAPPSRSGWATILQHVDRCAPEQTGALCEYIQSFMNQWDARIARDEIDHEFTSARREAWYQTPMAASQLHDIMPEFRLLPDRWMGELHHGIRSAKYNLPRALDLSDSKLSATDIGKLVRHEDLKHLHELILPIKKTMTQRLVRVLADLPSLKGLTPGGMDNKMLDALEKVDGATRLTSINLSTIHQTQQIIDREERLLSAPMLQTITTLKHHSQNNPAEQRVHETLANNPDLLPELHTLHYTRGLNPKALRKYVEEYPKSFARLSTLKISNLVLSHRSEQTDTLWATFTAIALPPSITTLDIGDVQFIVSGYGMDDMTFRSRKTLFLRQVLGQLIEGSISRHLRTLKLGIHGHEPEVIDYLKLYAPHITRA